MVFNVIHHPIVMCHSLLPAIRGFVCLLLLLIGFLLAEVRAIASMIEKQAQIVVKQKASVDSKTGKEAVLAQYANVTDEEEYPYCHFGLTTMTGNKISFLQIACTFFFLNKSTEAEEEESASGTKFPGSEQCILSQALPIRRSHGH